jgi:hypothetical protein
MESGGIEVVAMQGKVSTLKHIITGIIENTLTKQNTQYSMCSNFKFVRCYSSFSLFLSEGVVLNYEEKL